MWLHDAADIWDRFLLSQGESESLNPYLYSAEVATVILSTEALPAWSQTAQPLPDGSPDPQQYNDCGETCVSMIVAAQKGVPIGAGELRAAAGGTSRSGLTSAADLVAMLGYCHVSSHMDMLDAANARPGLQRTLKDARPVVMLGMWPTPGGTLHWLLATSADDNRVWYTNPWGGVRSWLSWSDFAVYYRGWLVVTDAYLHFQMHDAPEPF